MQKEETCQGIWKRSPNKVSLNSHATYYEMLSVYHTDIFPCTFHNHDSLYKVLKEKI
jgi:hypothetical protein